MELEFDESPDYGTLIQACSGIKWACLPLPFALDHVNCWLLDDEDSSILIDTGVNNALTHGHWESIFAGLEHWPAHLLVTHFHPDHMGLAGWFAQRGCANFLGSRQETELSTQLWSIPDEEYSQGYAKWYTLNGLPGDVVDVVRDNGNTYKKLVHQPPALTSWSFLDDGQVVTLAGRDYTIMKGQGHAPDMIMLYRSDDHVLIAADQVLPFISPNVSVMPRLPAANPLALFLETLDRLKKLPDDTLVLPSHGLPFRGLHGRLQALHEHHEMRLAQVLEACTEPRSAHDLFELMFRRKLDPQQTSFALGESLAHLHFLEHQGTIRRLTDDTLTRFVATG